MPNRKQRKIQRATNKLTPKLRDNGTIDFKMTPEQVKALEEGKAKLFFKGTIHAQGSAFDGYTFAPLTLPFPFSMRLEESKKDPININEATIGKKDMGPPIQALQNANGSTV